MPRIHCIVNQAAVQLTANVLLAVGAEPSMTDAPHETVSFVNSADALSVNLGMLSKRKRRSISIAAKTASIAQIPWVLDPAFINRSESRAHFCAQMLHYRPTVIRANQSEVETLCKLVDRSVEAISDHYGSIIATTGEKDRIICRQRRSELHLGHEWMARTTGMGCALSAIIAAYLSDSDDHFAAVELAIAEFSFAALAASDQSQGPGSFVAPFIDWLHWLHSTDADQPNANQAK